MPDAPSPEPSAGAGHTPSERSVVWTDGALQDPSTASVRWSDHGLTVGDGVFETIELRGGRPFALTRHLARLERSAAGLRLEPPARALVVEAVDAVSAAWGDEPGRLRVTFTAGTGPMGSERIAGASTLVVAASAMTVRTEATRVLVVPFTRNERGALVGLKTTSYAENVLALDHARERGASEAIFANTADELCEGTGSNVFLVSGGELVTPTLASGCLAGITRQLLLEALAAHGVAIAERDLPVGSLAGADEAFLVSTGRHVQPISHVDDVALPSAPGPITRRCAEVWHATYDDLVDP